jgi:hypothetical protein
MYVRAIYFCSMAPLKHNEPRSKIPSTVGTYQHPAVAHGMCQQAFLWLLDINKDTLKQVVPVTTCTGRYAAGTAHGNTGAQHRAKPAAKAHFVKQVEGLAAEYGHVQPWPLLDLEEEKPVYVLPPTWSRNAIYAHIMKTTPANLTLSDRAFEQLFNSDALTHVVIGKTARACARAAPTGTRRRAPTGTRRRRRCARTRRAAATRRARRR